MNIVDKTTPPYKNMADSYESKEAESPKNKQKRTHSPSAYNLFVRKHYDSVRNIPSPQDRMRELGRRWKAQKKKAPTKG